MQAQKRLLGFDSGALARAFSIQRFEANEPGPAISEWLQATFTLTAEEDKLLRDIHAKAQLEGDYWNEPGRRCGGAKNQFDRLPVLLIAD